MENCAPHSGMTSDQLTSALFHRKVQCSANAVRVKREASIHFLDMKLNRCAYMRRIVDARQASGEIKWPANNNRTSIAGGSGLSSWELKRIVDCTMVVWQERRLIRNMPPLLNESIHLPLLSCCLFSKYWLGPAKTFFNCTKPL